MSYRDALPKSLPRFIKLIRQRSTPSSSSGAPRADAMTDHRIARGLDQRLAGTASVAHQLHLSRLT